ncbi:SusC/RagA family TonB-linked outer membrane protein [Pedobacter sp. GR22-6]|uniref:SusC/RagA family TonB-linked outer membrane protein n=1 Tax=Pedobacter sp. GR22-6 TaxID=3127957 RepID=UPI00307D1D0D
MRLTIFLLILGTLAVQASGYAQKVSLSVRNANMESVFKDINKQTGYFFLYDADVLKKSGSISLDLNNAGLNEALKQVTAGKSLSYKIIDKTVIISEVKLNAKDITVKGTVRSKEGPGQQDLPIPGVIVTLKGTQKSVRTFENGSYFLEAPENGTLVFSMIGYATKEVPVNGKTTIDVLLNETASDLQEVIITAYGTKEKKENQVGSAFQMTRKDLDNRPLDRIDRLLEGVVPGVQVEMQDGTAASARPRYQTRIRGESSFSSSNEPLWVLDGIPINTGDETNMITGTQTSVSPLSYLNPNDIESITILKDATATSIYGANGANGVVLINTKKGLEGVNNVDYSFRTGINLLNNNRFHVLSADEYRELSAESFANSPLATNPIIDKGTSTDWYDVFFRNGITTQHDISFRGGNNKTRYFVSGAYFNEKPIMIKNSTQRFSSRINLDQEINNSIDMFFRLGASYNLNDMFNPGNAYYINRPIDSPLNPDGSYVMQFYNKLADAEFNDNNQKAMAINGNIGGKISIIPGLTYTTTNGIDYNSINENMYTSIYTFLGRDGAEAYKGQSTNFTWNSQHRLNYEKTINQHAFSVLLGGEASDKDRRSISSTGRGFANDKIREVSYAVTTLGTSSADEQSSLSYYGQFNYSLSEKYHLIASFRGDANSDFGSDVRWATFKSIGAAWTISKEDFWNIPAIDFAKLKLSYGNNGNSRIGAYKSKGIYSFSISNNYNGQPGAIMSNGENPGLSWETTQILNGGISLGLFGRISIDLEAYQNTTKDILDDVDVSRTSGFVGILQNLGSVRNTGVELTLNTQNIIKKDFEWRTRFNLAANRNKILKLQNGNDKVFGSTIRSEGDPLGTFYLIRWAGVDPRDGGPLWYDARGNLTKEFDLNNRVMLGTGNPDFFGGMTNTFKYKNFSLNALLVYNAGGYAFSNLQRDAESDGRNLAANNQSRNQLDRWREPGDLTIVPRTSLGENANNGRNSTRFLHKKTSLRLTNVSMNYNLPQGLLQPVKLRQASFYLQADNVGFWTPYKTKKNYNDYKNSFNPYPQPLVLSFGLNVGF